MSDLNFRPANVSSTRKTESRCWNNVGNVSLRVQGGGFARGPYTIWGFPKLGVHHGGAQTHRTSEAVSAREEGKIQRK